MDQILSLAAERLSGWDFMIAGIIVLAVEYCIKPLFRKTDEKIQGIICRLSPIALGALAYLVIALVQKSAWHVGLVHGLLVGLTSMGSYDVILKAMKESGQKSASDANDAVKKAIGGDE